MLSNPFLTLSIFFIYILLCSPVILPPFCCNWFLIFYSKYNRSLIDIASRNWFLVEYLTILIEFLLIFGFGYNSVSSLRRFCITFLVASFFCWFYLPQSIKFLTDSIWYFFVASSTAPNDKADFLCFASFLLFSLIFGLKSIPLFYCYSRDFLKFNSSLFFSRSLFNFDDEEFISLCVFFVKIGRDCIFESSDRYLDILILRMSCDFLWRELEFDEPPEDMRLWDFFKFGLDSELICFDDMLPYTAFSSSISLVIALGVLFLEAEDPLDL